MNRESRSQAPGEGRGERPRSRRWAVFLRVGLLVIALGIAGVLYAFPLYWLVATSLKSKAELYQSISLVPQHPTLASYGSVLFDRGFWVLLKNSVIVCAATVIVTIAIGLVITYPITRLSVPPGLRVGVLNWALSLRFLPPIAVVIPYFAIVRTLQIYDQPIALIAIYSLFNLPFAIWMLKGFLAEIPIEIEEVALVDGANRWTAFRKVLLPLATPGIMAAATIVFTFAWSEFLFALILTATPNAQTFPVGVQGLVTQFEIIWNDMAAAGVIAMTLPLILMVIGRKYMVAGLTFGVIREK
jgi:multiple sugar transport system permease protein